MDERDAVVWDGKDFAVIQMAFHKRRRNGRPCAEVDSDWNLHLNGSPIPVGATVMVPED